MQTQWPYIYQRQNSSFIAELPLPFQPCTADSRKILSACVQFYPAAQLHLIVADGAHILQIDHIAAPYLQKTVFVQHGGQISDFAVKGADGLVRDIAVDVDLPQITFQIIDLVERYLAGGTVVAHLQRLFRVGHAGKDTLQTAGQLGGNIALE